jgi:hypothetical protein
MTPAIIQVASQEGSRGCFPRRRPPGRWPASVRGCHARTALCGDHGACQASLRIPPGQGGLLCTQTRQGLFPRYGRAGNQRRTVSSFWTLAMDTVFSVAITHLFCRQVCRMPVVDPLDQQVFIPLAFLSVTAQAAGFPPPRYRCKTSCKGMPAAASAHACCSHSR